MSLLNLTSRQAVLQAIAEYDRIGQDKFLTKYGFGQARRYFLKFGERFYDSKAIVGAAYGYQFPNQGPLSYTDFVGGENTVKPKLEELGFEVVVEAE